MRTRFLMAAAIAAAFTVPAANADTLTVTLDVSLVDDAVDYAGCDVSVDEGADGFDVLDAAVDAGCIDSYEASDFGFGRYLTCIDGICGIDAPTWAIPVPTVYAGTYWAVTIDDAYAEVGLDDHLVGDGEEIGLTYEPYVFPA